MKPFSIAKKTPSGSFREGNLLSLSNLAYMWLQYGWLSTVVRQLGMGNKCWPVNDVHVPQMNIKKTLIPFFSLSLFFWDYWTS